MEIFQENLKFEKVYLMGRKDHKHPPGGHPTSGSTNWDKPNATKRKNPGGSGITPEGKKNIPPNTPETNFPEQPLGPDGHKTTSSLSSSPAQNLGAFEQTSGEDSNKNSASVPAAKSPRSVSSILDKCHVTEQDEKFLEDMEQELGDFNEETERNIGNTEMGITDDSGEPATKKTYAKVTDKQTVCGFEVIYVHMGTKTRDPIPWEMFHKLYDCMQAVVLDIIFKVENVSDGILWNS